MDNYNQLIKLMAENSGLSLEEIDRRIEAKKAKLSGLITREGAAQIVAAELNLNFEKQFLKISHFLNGMRKINVIGKIALLYPVREYNKNGRSGRIASFILADDTSNIRTVLWDENHIDLIVNKEINDGSTVEIMNASLRNGELHLGSFSEIKLSEKIIEGIVLERPVVKKEIIEFTQGDVVCTRAFIVQIFEPRFFEVCPECKKKVNELKECVEHGRVVPDRRVVLSFIIDDGSDSARSSIFSEDLDKIITREELENHELFSLRKKEFIGKEVLITGSVRRNNYSNSNDFIVNEIKEIDVDKLIEELENEVR